MAPPRRQATILVVEDDPGLRAFYRTSLAFAGYVVLVAEDGIDALRLIEGSAPQAVVLDMALPRLHGGDVQREIASHAETRHVPIILVTGTDVSGVDTTAFACVLVKPVSADQLVVAVQNCLQ